MPSGTREPEAVQTQKERDMAVWLSLVPKLDALEKRLMQDLKEREARRMEAQSRAFREAEEAFGIPPDSSARF